MIDTEALRRKVLTLAIKGDLLTEHVQNSALSQIRKLSKELNGSDFKMVSDELTPFEIPSNWIWCRLSDIGTTNIGLTYHPKEVCEDGIPVLRSNNIQNNAMDYSDLIKVNCEVKEKQYLYPNDILICARNGSKNLVGKCAIYDGGLGDVSFGAFMAVYRSSFYQYVYYFFLTSVFRSNFENENNKQINQVTQKILKDALIPIPPYEEQELIVNRIKDLFDQIKILDTLQQQYANNITSLNKKILDLAVRGKLVPQDPNDEPASVLLNRIREVLPKRNLTKGELNHNSMDFPIPNSWEWMEFNDLFEFIDYRGKTPHKIREGVFLVTASNIKRGYLDYTRKEYISEEEYQDRQRRGVTHKGDLIFTTEAPMGNVAICNLEKCSCGQRVITFQPVCEDTILPELYMYFILSPPFQKQLQDNSSGITAKGIKADRLKHFKIPLPPYAEQRRILNTLKMLLPTRALENNYIE